MKRFREFFPGGNGAMPAAGLLPLYATALFLSSGPADDAGDGAGRSGADQNVMGAHGM